MREACPIYLLSSQFNFVLDGIYSGVCLSTQTKSRRGLAENFSLYIGNQANPQAEHIRTTDKS